MRASVEECARRDALYEKALRGEIEGFTGISDPYEAPLAPEVLLDTECESPDESARDVLAFIEQTFKPASSQASAG